MLVEELSAGLQREARLPDTASSGQRQEARLGEEVFDFGDVFISPEKTRDLDGKIIGQRVERAQRRKFREQTLGVKLEDLFGMCEVLQALRSQAAQARACWHLGLGEIGG